MTPEDAVYELYNMPSDGDAECLHGRADEILCEVLKSLPSQSPGLGPKDVAGAFEEAKERCGFWYA